MGLFQRPRVARLERSTHGAVCREEEGIRLRDNRPELAKPGVKAPPAIVARNGPPNRTQRAFGLISPDCAFKFARVHFDLSARFANEEFSVRPRCRVAFLTYEGRQGFQAFRPAL